MTIWADADSLPREVKNLIARRASSPRGGKPEEAATRAVFVANRSLALPPGSNLIAVTVGMAGASNKAGGQAAAPGHPEATVNDSADDYILSAAKPGDILVTRDIPLAAKALAAGIIAMNDRGALWTEGELRERVSLRDHMATLRGLGIAPPSAKGRNYGPKEARAFADALDKAIAKSRAGGQAP